MTDTISLGGKENVVNENRPFTVGIVGGGVAGSTAALKLAGVGINTVLFEAGRSLVSGPPICHLHAGGNLYREISEAQCIALLEQSIATVRAYPHAMNRRPTVIAVPVSDDGEPEHLLPRLEALTARYRSLIEEDAENAVLGHPDQYFTLFSKADMEHLATQPLPSSPTTAREWMIPLAHYMPLDNFKYPLVVVQEYGLSVFRLAATASLALEQSPLCDVKFGHRVEMLTETENGWQVESLDANGQRRVEQVDYLINAAGFRTGQLDDMANTPRQRWVEYKAAYVAHWPSQPGVWPEVIVHGERGTPNGMAQFTPYPQGFVQLHGMTQDITLFDGGLVQSSSASAQPLLPVDMVQKADGDWSWDEIRERTQRAISHFTRWLPDFEQAEVGGRPLCGAQQIPGNDPTLRAADASFEGERYARIELVKASSALQAADRILAHIEQQGWASLPEDWQDPTLPLTLSQSAEEVVEKGKALAFERGYPEALAMPFPASLMV